MLVDINIVQDSWVKISTIDSDSELLILQLITNALIMIDVMFTFSIMQLYY